MQANAWAIWVVSLVYLLGPPNNVSIWEMYTVERRLQKGNKLLFNCIGLLGVVDVVAYSPVNLLTL